MPLLQRALPSRDGAFGPYPVVSSTSAKTSSTSDQTAGRRIVSRVVIALDRNLLCPLVGMLNHFEVVLASILDGLLKVEGPKVVRLAVGVLESIQVDIHIILRVAEIVGDAAHSSYWVLNPRARLSADSRGAKETFLSYGAKHSSFRKNEAKESFEVSGVVDNFANGCIKVVCGLLDIVILAGPAEVAGRRGEVCVLLY